MPPPAPQCPQPNLESAKEREGARGPDAGSGRA